MVEKGECNFCGKETLVATGQDVKICIDCALLALKILVKRLEGE